MPEVSTQQTTKLPGVFELLKQAWQVYTKRFLTFISILIAPLLISYVISALARLAGQGGKNVVVVVLAGIIGFIVTLWQQAALIYGIKGSEEGIKISEALLSGAKKIIPFFWVSLLSILLIGGGFIVLIIPAIIFMIWVLFSSFILVAEDVRGLKAILKSRECVKGMWWPVFGRVISACLLVLVVGLIIGVIGGVAAVSKVSEVSLVFNLLFYIVFGLIISPILVIYFYLIYKNLRNLKGEVEIKSKKWPFVIFIVLGIIFFILSLVIAPLSLTALGSAQIKSRDAFRVSEVKWIQTAAELYQLDNKVYPNSLDDLVQYANKLQSNGISSVDKYGNSMIVDPSTKTEYKYQALGSGSDYELCIKFEQILQEQCLSSKGISSETIDKLIEFK